MKSIFGENDQTTTPSLYILLYREYQSLRGERDRKINLYYQVDTVGAQTSRAGRIVHIQYI